MAPHPDLCRSLCAVLVLLAGCDCRSDEEVAERVFENAAALTRPPPARVTNGPRTTADDPCRGAPGTLVAVTDEAPGSPVVSVHDGTVFVAQATLFSVPPGAPGTVLLRGEWLTREMAVSAAGVFLVTQSDRSPVETRLVWRAPDGTVTRALEDRDDLLLSGVVAVDDGALVFAGRVLGSQGPASQLLHFSTATKATRVVTDRERGVLDVVADGADLYWLEHPQVGRGQSGLSAVVVLREGSDRAEVLTESPGRLSNLVVGDEALYWIEGRVLGDEMGRLVKMPKEGHRPAVEVHPAARRTYLLVSHRRLFAQLEGRGRLHAIDPDTGAATVVVDGPGHIASPVISGGHLYWITAPTTDPHGTTRCVRALALSPPS